MAKTKLQKTEKEPFKWETWTNLSIQIILVLITIFSFRETQKSTKTAQDALDLQRIQAIESQKKDSLNSIQDSIRNEKFIASSEQQIEALKQQALALERGVKNTEILQRPLLDIVNFGFHFSTDSNLIFYYQIKNDGIKPAILDTVILYTFEANFSNSNKKIDYPNIILANDKHSQVNQPIIISGKKYSTVNEDFILSINSFYCYFVLYYTDPYSKKRYDSHQSPIFYKWIKKPKNDHYIMKKDNEKYYVFELCSKEEEQKIMAALKKREK